MRRRCDAGSIECGLITLYWTGKFLAPNFKMISISASSDDGTNSLLTASSAYLLVRSGTIALWAIADRFTTVQFIGDEVRYLGSKSSSCGWPCAEVLSVVMQKGRTVRLGTIYRPGLGGTTIP